VLLPPSKPHISCAHHRIDYNYNNTNMAQQPVLWKKRVLVPFWVLRICIMIFIIAAYAITLRAIDDASDIIKPATAYVHDVLL
jgi:hypothetical protein